jgi:DNA-binding NarL/FixJ family response regulator
MIPSSQPSSIDLLTERETEILTFLLDGKCNKEIACALDISVRTVRFHVSNILAKYNVENRLTLVVACSRSANSMSGGIGSRSHTEPDQAQLDCG